MIRRQRNVESEPKKIAKPAVEQLEARWMMADSTVVAGTKIKGINLSANNISTNQTLITIPFTGNINLADATKIRVFGYALNPLSSALAQIKKTVNVVKAEVITADANGDGTLDHSLLQLTTDRLMRKGGQITFFAGAYTDDQGNTNVEHFRKTVKGQNKERFTLANRAFNPTNFNRFTNDIFASSPTPAAGSTDIPDATVTANLDAFLQKKVTNSVITQAQKDAAMATYNSSAAVARISNANLRAALISLTGTFAQAAISNFLGPQYIVIAFQDPGDSSVEVARTTVKPDDGRLRTVIRPEFDGEPFQVLSAWLAHEALHQDSDFKLQEEVIANMMGTMVNAQQAQTDANYLKTGTLLVNRENEKLLALVNSGRTIFPYVGVKQAPMLNAADGVFRGGKAVSGGVYTSFEDYLRRTYTARGSVSGNTAGNAILNSYYNAIQTGTGKTAAANMQFSDQVIADIDAFQAPVFPRAAIIVAQALKLGLS
jgi:hypothetical protein